MSAAAESPPVIEFRNVSYAISGKAILDKLSLVVRNGETLVLLGRSGSGKTIALKLINRLREPSAGEVIVSEKPTISWDPTVLRRRIGYVIQEIGLFPHFTVERNIALVPHLENWPKERIRTRVREALQIETRYPHELSGGQRQRVGVARALAADPPILLMDEPFGALDPLTRAELQGEFQEIQRKLAKTVVFVTHDLSEALLLGTRIALLEGGKLAGVYTPEEFANACEPVAAAYLATLRTGESALDKLERH
jgi:osmoprotectant transport system ATP-binding protein